MTELSTSAVDSIHARLPVDSTALSLRSGFPAVRRAVRAADAVGFVHVGGPHDADRRYLARLDGPNREAAVICIRQPESCDLEAVYCVPTDVLDRVEEFERTLGDEDGLSHRVEGYDPATPVGQAVRAVLADRLDADNDGTLLVPRVLPHDTAVYLQQAGYELQSTAAVAAARASKTAAEQEALGAVQAAAAAGMARAETVLATCEATEGKLAVDGRPLTAERLGRLVDAELAASGVRPAGNTEIESATTDTTDQLPVGTPIRLTVAPRGPHGYHGWLTRTLTVDSDGGWERRAFIAAEAGVTAARRQAAVGVDVSAVRAEAVAEIGAYGFAAGVDTPESTEAWATATVNGIGLAAYEPPAPSTESELQSGSVITIEAGVVDARRGTVRLGEVFVVTSEGAEPLVEYPSSVSPRQCH